VRLYDAGWASTKSVRGIIGSPTDVTASPSHTRSPAPALLFGLIITLAVVGASSWYLSRQITRLSDLQRELADRNRRDSLQLLRIQNDLNQLGLAMRDMLDREGTYPLAAWSAQFDRIRTDLDDALRRQEDVSVTQRTPEQRELLGVAFKQFWDAADRMFALARAGQEAEARSHVQVSLQARQAALSSTVAQQLVQNNENEAQTAAQVQAIYAQVQRQAYWFLAAALAAIGATSLYLIHANRRLFARLAALSDERRGLAQALITTREDTLREISRELHDEFGQVLTAIGSMITRAGRHVDDASLLRADLREVGEVAQAALDSVRGLSQTLHPSILEELGLSSTVDWYLSTVERQLGLRVTYHRPEAPTPVRPDVAIQAYRVLQEALSNVARHAGTGEAIVRLAFKDGALHLEVEDHGPGLPAASASSRGLGLVAMRERAELVGGTVTWSRPPAGGTLVSLVVPL
jgi:signal transduction histidine kinase